ncbi:MAG TPA: glycosyltransferase [Pyrinomonadaceae bacterium]|nr:glycosyltransferase [Pyrinomonadaceae bacterium]
MKSEVKPVVSVVIPTRNAGLYVRETIFSVLNQTFEDLELIIVDNGSTDNTAEVVEATIADFADRPITFFSREDRGLCASLNEGLALSRGEYFSYVGADDVWEPDKLEVQVAELTKTGLPAAYSDCTIIDGDGKKLGRYSEQYAYHGGDIYEDLIWARFQPASPTNLFRRETVAAVGGFDQSQVWEDRDLWIRIAKDNEVVYTEWPLAAYRVHANNCSTSNLDSMYEYAIQVLDAAVTRDPALVPDKPRLRAAIDAQMAGAYFEKLQMSEARRYAVKALLQRPDSRLAWRTFLLSTLGAGNVKRFRDKRRGGRGKGL